MGQGWKVWVNTASTVAICESEQLYAFWATSVGAKRLCLWNSDRGCSALFVQNGAGAVRGVIKMGRKPSVTSLSPRCHTDTGDVGSLRRPSASCQERVHIQNKNVMPTEAMGTFVSDTFRGRVCHNKCLGVGRRIREGVRQLLFNAFGATSSTKWKQRQSEAKTSTADLIFRKLPFFFSLYNYNYN